MDIFETQTDGAVGEVRSIEVQLPGITAPESAASGAARRASDPHQAVVDQAVRTMKERHWGKGTMVGELYAEWQRCFAALLTNASDAEGVSRAAQLADYAWLVAHGRQPSGK